MSGAATSQSLTLIIGLKPTTFVAVAMVTAATVVGLVLVIQVTALPEYVDEFSVENNTDFHIRVEVSDGQGRSWLMVGTVQAGTTEAFSRLIDQGEVWLFRFHGQGKVAGELRLDRSQLEREGWRLRIPVWVADELRAQGAIPPP